MNENPKVVLVSFSELPTLQKYMYLTFSELRSRGIEAWTIGSNNLQLRFTMTERNLLIDTPHSPKPTVGSIKDALQNAGELAQQIVDLGPDVVHFVNKHTWNYFLIRALRKSAPNVKIVHTFHDPVGHSGDSVQKGVILYHKVVQRMLDAVIVHSDIARRQAEEQLKVPCSLNQVPLGVCPWLEWNPEINARRVLIFGRINAYKGVSLYPDILRCLAAVVPQVEVVIAGKASDDVDLSLLNEINCQPNAKLINRFIDESELDGFFEDCSLVLMPYTSVTQSGVVLDAYSHSRSVVAFDIEGMSQYVPDKNALVTAFDCAKFADRVAGLLGNEEALMKSNRSAWEFGRSNYSPTSMASGLLNVYRSIIE